MANIVELFELCRGAAKSTLEKSVDAGDTEIIRILQDILMRIDQGPVRVIIFGETNSGKGTIINALTEQRTVPEAVNISTVGSLFSGISQSVEQLIKSEKDIVDKEYYYDPSKKLPDFGVEELRMLSQRSAALNRLERKLPKADDSLVRLQGRISNLETINMEFPELNMQEVIDAINCWRNAEEALKQDDLKDSELSKLLAAMKEAKALLTEYTNAKERMYVYKLNFNQTASSFINDHSYAHSYNCSEAEIWYCEGNAQQMNHWFLSHVAEGTLSPIYDKVTQDYSKISKTVISGLNGKLTDDLNHNSIAEIRDSLFDICSGYIAHVNHFFTTHVQDTRYQTFKPAVKVNHTVDIPSPHMSETKLQDFLSSFETFVNDKISTIKNSTGAVKRMQSWWVRHDFGTVCAKKVGGFFDGEVKECVNDYYDTLKNNLLNSLKQDADNYVMAMTEPKNAINNLFIEFQIAYKRRYKCVHNELSIKLKIYKEECRNAIERLLEMYEVQKAEMIGQYDNAVKSIIQKRYDQIYHKYSNINNMLDEISLELEKLKSTI